jgi:peptide/nickel transport system substrate-binding protein
VSERLIDVRILPAGLCCWLLAALLSGPAGAGAAPGTFVTVVSDNPDNLNPYLHSLLDSSFVDGFTFDSLYRFNDHGDWEAGLATASTVSADGLTWTFTLRPGVRWSDGQPFSSADVKFTWQLVNRKDVHITYATGFDKIASVDTPSPTSVVYHLREPYAPFRDQIAGAAIVPRHVLAPLSGDDINRAPFNQQPVGTGPFAVAEFVTDDHVTLTVNRRYWGPAPKLGRIEIRIIPDQNTQVNLLRAGELSLLRSVPPARLEETRHFPAVVIKRYLTPVYALVQLDEYGFLRDAVVRRALDFATPKDSIIRDVMRGQAEPAASDMVPNGPFADKGLRPRPYDPVRAKKMLLDDGFAPGSGGFLFKGGRRLEVPIWTVSSRQYFVQTMEIIAQAWRQIGIAIDTHAVSAAALFGQGGPQWDGRDAALIFSWGQGVFPENRINWHSSYIPQDATSAGENAERYASPEMDSLLDQADRTVDDAKRRAIYQRIQAIEHRDVPVIFLFWFVDNNAVATNVGGYDVTTFGTTPPETWTVR